MKIARPHIEDIPMSYKRKKRLQQQWQNSRKN